MSWNPDDVVVAAIGRSPIGRAGKGALKDLRPDDLATQIVSSVVDQVDGLREQQIEDLIIGCAEPHDEQGGNIARRIAVQAGIMNLPGTTVNRFCASSVQATRMAFHGIRAGEGDAYIVGGVESISRSYQHENSDNPRFDEAKQRAEHQAMETDTWIDPQEVDQLPDIYLPMGYTAEFVARHKNVSRKAQDAYAARSQQRAVAAQESGFAAREIIPVKLYDGSVVETDDSPRPGTTMEKLSELSPVFVPNGTVTAGNACPLNDGASAAVILSGARATALGAAPKARLLSSAVSALSPEIMGLGPVKASKIALQRANLTVADMDAVEINEAFAAQVIPSAAELGISDDILNPHGGAIALGHPFGATGVRMLGTLINDLETMDGTFGLLSLCIGGGQGMAMVIERL